MNNERKTRQERIDVQLGRAGWPTGSRQLLTELHLANPRRLRDEDSGDSTSNEFVDYALVDRYERIIAIVEAKCSSRDALAGERQAEDYALALEAKNGFKPFVFLSNGDEIWFLHHGKHPVRKVSAFFTEDDLIRLAHLDKFGQSLHGEIPKTPIAFRAAEKRIPQSPPRANCSLSG